MGELIVGGVLVYREEGLVFWLGVSALIGGLVSVAFSMWAVDNSVAKAAQDSIEDTDLPADSPLNSTEALEPVSQPFEHMRDKRDPHTRRSKR